MALPATPSLSGSLPVLACGAHVKNRACLLQEDYVAWSSLHGELDSVESRHALEKTMQRWFSHTGRVVSAVAHDMHPDFYSSQLAVQWSQAVGVPAVPVQHHHAHVASVIASHGLSKPVVGIALDGMGLGANGTLWGGELLLVGGADQAHQWQRLAHLNPIMLPGGDRAACEPWRLAAAVLQQSGRGSEIIERFAPIVGKQTASIVRSMLVRDINSPPSSSAGRWFDAASAALGISIHKVYEADAAQLLEQHATEWLLQFPDFDWPWESLDLLPVVNELFCMESVSHGAAVFHLALVNGLAKAATTAAAEHNCNEIVLAGGCFANRLLSDRLSNALQHAGLAVYRLPAECCGDDTLALGQALVAACLLCEQDGFNNRTARPRSEHADRRVSIEECC